MNWKWITKLRHDHNLLVQVLDTQTMIIEPQNMMGGGGCLQRVWRVHVLTNQRPVFRSRDQSGPIRGQYLHPMLDASWARQNGGGGTKGVVLTRAVSD